MALIGQEGKARVAIVAGDPSNNQMGRAQSVYRVALAGGFDARLVTVDQDSPLWPPLVDSEADRALTRVTAGGLRSTLRTVDAVIAIKPRWDSLGQVWGICSHAQIPLLVDIDDPDLEVGWSELRRVRQLRHPVRAGTVAIRLGRLTRMVRGLPCTTSNPELNAKYGGTVLPHARPDRGEGGRHVSRHPTVAFIGTPRPHKGLSLLRSAIAELAPRGFRLVVTAQAPLDAPVSAWEKWTGELPEEDAIRLLKSSDIVVIPSLREAWGESQLPMKLIDAMLAGRAIVVSDLKPMTWATAGTAKVFAAGSRESLVCALADLADPNIRENLGRAARAQALARFTPAALAPAFVEAIKTSAGAWNRSLAVAPENSL